MRLLTIEQANTLATKIATDDPDWTYVVVEDYRQNPDYPAAVLIYDEDGCLLGEL